MDLLNMTIMKAPLLARASRRDAMSARLALLSDPMRQLPCT
jgi:hypothetical protein